MSLKTAVVAVTSAQPMFERRTMRHCGPSRAGAGMPAHTGPRAVNAASARAGRPNPTERIRRSRARPARLAGRSSMPGWEFRSDMAPDDCCRGSRRCSRVRPGRSRRLRGPRKARGRLDLIQCLGVAHVLLARVDRRLVVPRGAPSEAQGRGDEPPPPLAREHLGMQRLE